MVREARHPVPVTDPKGSDKMRRAEREVGQNIPQGMIGLDTEDVGDPSLREKGVLAKVPATEEDADKSA